MARIRMAAVATLVLAGITLAGCAGGGAADADNTIDGEVKGDIKVVTWRTDLVEDGTFQKIRRAETPMDYFATLDCTEFTFHN